MRCRGERGGEGDGGGASFAKKKCGAPTASNSIPVVREREINRVEIEKKGRGSALRVRLLCIALLLTDKRGTRKMKKDEKRRE